MRAWSRSCRAAAPTSPSGKGTVTLPLVCHNPTNEQYQVRINTSDTEWIERHGTDPVAYGSDIKGVMYFGTTIESPESSA